MGKGFLAGYLVNAFHERYPGVTAIAAGVTRTQQIPVSEFDREAELVYDIVRRCRERNRTVVFFSTASDGMYGGSSSPCREDGPVFPTTPYGRHKLALESVLANSGAHWLVLRLSHVIGRGQQPHQLIPSLVTQIRSGTVRIYRHAYRDLLDVRHMIAALDSLLAASVTDRVVNVATGSPEPIDRIVDEIEGRLGLLARRTIVDAPAGCTVVSTARLREILPAWDLRFGPEYLPRLLDEYIGPGPVCDTAGDIALDIMERTS